MVYCLFKPDLKFGFTLPEKGIISELEIDILSIILHL